MFSATSIVLTGIALKVISERGLVTSPSCSGKVAGFGTKGLEFKSL